MMDYSPINYRRMDWFTYNPAWEFAWRDKLGHRDLDKDQAALVRQSFQGYMK